ncbi:MAG TPA: metalloregulator ArsR/SmtB family transcription factor [Myxococcaceae bacterium]|jgi:DNA-binding transcriptional ArsR family regulator|nr:metalloregulator ArsR/SmtB family transcription factor [Myxococcaceae bacterium]
MSPSVRHRAAEPSELFAALGDRTRLALVRRLAAEGALSVTALTGGTRISRQAVTKHLGVLARTGLVQSERQGRERLWSLAPGQIAEARRALEQISRRWDEALGRLRTLVER